MCFENNVLETNAAGFLKKLSGSSFPVVQGPQTFTGSPIVDIWSFVGHAISCVCACLFIE